MALTLTIGATNYLPQYVTNSARIRERIQNQSNTLNLELVKRAGAGHNTPQEGKEIVLKDGSRFLFGGFITRVDPIETGEGQLFRYRIEATDYTYILLNKSAQKTYANQTLAAIVSDLLSVYVDSGYGLTTTNVATGPTIDTIAFNHVSLRKAFEKLAQVTGNVWWVDYEKDIHFIDGADITVNPAPEDITDSSDNFTGVSIQCDVSQVRNSIVVRGGREETTSDLVQIIEADGVASEWLLREKPKTMTSIEVDTGGGYAAQTVGVDPIDDDAGNNFMFNFQEKFIRQASGESLLNAGDLIRVTYKYEVPVIVKLKDTASILAMAALNGGDGLHEHVIVNPSVNSKAEARKIALQELAEYANPIVSGTFETRTGLLQASSIFQPGQLLTANLPTWGISTDTEYLIQEVLITLVEDGSSIEYNYTVTFGGRLLGVSEFLESLAGEEHVILATEEVERIEAVQETATISESVSLEPNTQDVSESATVSEDITRTNYTPPFQWGPGGSPQAVWNLSEWS